jgi:hypothetical protein
MRVLVLLVACSHHGPSWWPAASIGKAKFIMCYTMQEQWASNHPAHLPTMLLLLLVLVLLLLVLVLSHGWPAAAGPAGSQLLLQQKAF